MSKEARVKEFFEQPEIYFHYDYNIKIRHENIKALLEGKNYKNVLDMPCGNGGISLPLINQFEHLTLIDFSSNMVELARKSTPDEVKDKVTYINNDFYNVDFPKGSFDLIISMGILAHIKDPVQFVKDLSELLGPGGVLILQNTNHEHFYAKLIRGYLGVRKIVGKDKYTLNKVKSSEILKMADKCGLEVKKQFNYNQSFLGFSKLFSNDKKYQLTRKWFGKVEESKGQSLGSDNTWLFVKKS